MRSIYVDKHIYGANCLTKVGLVNIWYHQIELVGVVAHSYENHQSEHKHTYD